MAIKHLLRIRENAENAPCWNHVPIPIAQLPNGGISRARCLLCRPEDPICPGPSNICHRLCPLHLSITKEARGQEVSYRKGLWKWRNLLLPTSHTFNFWTFRPHAHSFICTDWYICMHTYINIIWYIILYYILYIIYYIIYYILYYIIYYIINILYIMLYCIIIYIILYIILYIIVYYSILY